MAFSCEAEFGADYDLVRVFRILGHDLRGIFQSGFVVAKALTNYGPAAETVLEALAPSVVQDDIVHGKPLAFEHLDNLPAQVDCL